MAMNRIDYWSWKRPVQPKEPDEKGLLVYAVDFGTNADNAGHFKRDVSILLRQCIQQKIFSASHDSLAMVRTDAMDNLAFSSINWETLRELDTNILQPDTERQPKKAAVMEAFESIFALMDVQAEEDNYTVKKILFLSEFKTKMNEGDVSKFVENIASERVFVSFVVPEVNFNEIQTQNLEVLKQKSENCDYISILPMDEVKAEMNNTVCKKAVKPMPWNITMEIGTDLTLNVSGYLCTRKNKSTETKSALLKTVEKLPVPTTSSAAPVAATGASSSDGPRPNTNNTAEVELASKVVSKEEHWEQNDGTIVDPENIVNGYYYGDKLVSFDEIQQSASYTTGEKCFKVLLFCPKEQIIPYYLVDEGTDLFFAKKGETASDLIFTALLQVLQKTNKVAVVRKIRTKDAKLSIGVLSPDIKRRCLVYVNLCFADDITLPKFPLLFKPEELENNNLSDKDALMDQFIMSKSIDTFSPFKGPVDPAVQMFRENITQKIIGKSYTTSAAVELFDPKKADNIQAYFDNLVKQNSAIMDAPEPVQKKLCLTFPCREIEIKGTERAAGVNVFRKRNLSSEPIKEEEKKIKVEPPSLEVDQGLNEEPPDADQFDVDNLLDDL